VPEAKRNIAGAAIRQIRQQAGLSQSELSVAVEVDHGIALAQSDISEIERGARHVTDIELVAFAAVLKVSPDVLLAKVGNETN